MNCGVIRLNKIYIFFILKFHEKYKGKHIVHFGEISKRFSSERHLLLISKKTSANK